MYQSRLVQEVRLTCYPKEKFKLPVTTRFYSRSGWGVGGGGGVWVLGFLDTALS